MDMNVSQTPDYRLRIADGSDNELPCAGQGIDERTKVNRLRVRACAISVSVFICLVAEAEQQAGGEPMPAFSMGICTFEKGQLPGKGPKRDYWRLGGTPAVVRRSRRNPVEEGTPARLILEVIKIVVHPIPCLQKNPVSIPVEIGQEQVVLTDGLQVFMFQTSSHQQLRMANRGTARTRFSLYSHFKNESKV